MNDQGERILQLERMFRDLQTELMAVRGQFVPQHNARTVRLAKVATATVGTDGRKFGVIFVDGAFDATTTSNENPTYVDRQKVYQTVAYNLGTQTPTVGTYVLCFEVSGKWWFSSGAGSSSTTPVTVAPTRVYRNARYWKTNGLEDTASPGYFYGASDQVRRVTFHESVGDAIPGLTHSETSGDAVGSFTVTEPSTYLLTLSCNGEQTEVYTASPSPPSPAVGYSMRVEIFPVSALTVFASQTICSQHFRTDMPIDFGFSGTPFPSVDIYSFGFFSFAGQRTVRWVPSPPSIKRFGLEIQRLASPSADDFGFLLRDLELSITRIE